MRRSASLWVKAGVVIAGASLAASVWDCRRPGRGVRVRLTDASGQPNDEMAICSTGQIVAPGPAGVYEFPCDAVGERVEFCDRATLTVRRAGILARAHNGMGLIWWEPQPAANAAQNGRTPGFVGAEPKMWDLNPLGTP
jgi:hypothetical protein